MKKCQVCGKVYRAESKFSFCPHCGISEYMIEASGSTDAETIRNFDWRMNFKHDLVKEIEIKPHKDDE